MSWIKASGSAIAACLLLGLALAPAAALAQTPCSEREAERDRNVNLDAPTAINTTEPFQVSFTGGMTSAIKAGTCENARWLRLAATLSARGTGAGQPTTFTSVASRNGRRTIGAGPGEPLEVVVYVDVQDGKAVDPATFTLTPQRLRSSGTRRTLDDLAFDVSGDPNRQRDVFPHLVSVGGVHRLLLIVCIQNCSLGVVDELGDWELGNMPRPSAPPPTPVVVAPTPPATANVPSDAVVRPSSPNEDAVFVRVLQAELKRVGCYKGAIDGRWSATTQSALRDFQAKAKASPAILELSDATLAALRDAPPRVCRPACAPDETEVKSECVAKPRPQVARPVEQPRPKVAVPAPTSAAPPSPSRSAQDRKCEPKPNESYAQIRNRWRRC